MLMAAVVVIGSMRDTNNLIPAGNEIHYPFICDKKNFWELFTKGKNMNTRSLGMICMVGSAVILLDALRMFVLGMETNDFDTINLVTGSIWAIGAIAGLIGLIRLNVLGANPVVRALGFIPIIGFTLLILANIFQLAGLYTTDNNTWAGIGWLVEMAGMVLVGILVVAAKVWRGWQRFVPLLAVVCAPLAFALGSLIHSASLAIIPFYGLWVLLGYLVATANSEELQKKMVTA